MNELKIPVIEGTIRKKRKSIYVANLIVKIGNTINGVKANLVDPKNFNIPHDGNDIDNKLPEYSKITKEADAFVIVSPEYNHSFPGSLKRLLDTELENYIHKPVMLVGVSSGRWGGTRVVEALTNPVKEMGMVSTFSPLYFPNVGDLFDENGNLTEKNVEKRIKNAFTELIWMAKTLRYGRKNFPSKYHPS